MPLSPGARIGVFEVVAKLGEGGMGEVYRARDTKLDRDVALKVLPELFTSDAERLARFEREAKVLASLNHPNIAQVYGFEGNAIAMELVDGSTLEELIRSGPESSVQRPASGPNSELRTSNSEASGGMPVDRALAIVRQIATALEAAHDQGIIHRDLKPANVKVREDGTVKVLDFGLAKAFAADAESAASGVSNSPTLTARSTQLGMILGTAAYMAPEQAKGRPVDRRADVWAFGVVFFEMLAGRRAFEGDDVSDVLASVLKSEPDWSALPADLPGPVRRLLKRCLEKDPKRRLRDVAEGMLQLDEGLASGSTSSSIMSAVDLRSPNSEVRTPPRPFWRRAVPLVATAAVTALAVVAVYRWTAAPPSPPLPAAFLHSPQTDMPLYSSLALRDVAISPNGRTIAYAAGPPGSAQVAIYVRAIDQIESVPLRGAQPAIGPFFSADSAWVGFLDQADQSQIKKVPALGGPSVSVTKATSQVLGATWTADGFIIFGGRGEPLQQVGEAGGEPTPLTTVESGETGHLWPSAVPGTSVVLFVAETSVQAGRAVNTQLAAFDRVSKRTVRFKMEGFHPRYASSGHIVYAAVDGSLRALAFDSSTLSVSGNPIPVIEGVGVKTTGAANFDLSSDGHIVYSGAGALGAARTISWVARDGKETPITGAPARTYYYARVSPDGSRLSLDVRDQEEDIWIWDVKRESIGRLTDKAGSDSYGLWMPDQRVVFASAAEGRTELFIQRSDGVGQPQQLTDTAADKLVPFPNAITPDGKQVIFRSAVGGPKNDLFIVDITGDKDKKVRKLLGTEHDERNAALSPDGKFMAFESDLSGGRMEVFIRPFPNVDGGQYKVSVDGGSEPVWAPSGKEVFYVAGTKLMAVPVKTAPALELGKPVELFDVANYYFGGAGRNYDVAPDGKRFIMVKNPVGEQGRSLPVTIVLNWAETLRARVK